MIRTITICIALVAILPSLGYGASFDCRQAAVPVEKLVCGSSDARVLDVQLYEAYQRAQRLSANRDSIRGQQRRWVKESRNLCKTVECLAKVYKSRISELESGIRYKECEDDSGSTLSIGYCIARKKQETENTIEDLISLLPARYAADQIYRFKNIQSDWKKNAACRCFNEVGRGSGPGWSSNFSSCEKNEADQRLLEIREIVAGLQTLEYVASGPKVCAEIRSEEEANPEHQMIQAITKNDINNVKRLLKEGTPMPRGDYSYTPIDIAVRNNNIEMLSFLLGNGADPNQDIEAMKAALMTCNKKMVSLLVDHGYQVKGNPSYYGPYDPLPWAAQFGCRDIVEYLVANGADVKSYMPLRQAASQCHVETVKYLLSKVQDPDLPDGDNRTPLLYAAITAVNWPDKRSACMVVISELIQAGANPERAFVVPAENPALKLPRDGSEVMKLLHSRSNAN